MTRLLAAAFVVATVLSACATLEDTVKQKPETNVTYTSEDGTQVDSYLSLPDGPGPHPGVLMIHEWWGLNQDTAILADALAAEGFVVLAADALRGALATSVPAAIAQMSSTPKERIRADLDAALAFLMRHPQVDGSRVATMGFCFGGRESMYLGIRSEGLAAVVTLYGSGLVTDPDELGNLAENAPVLGIFGENDGSIPLREVEAFRAALDSLGAPNTVTVYPGVGHAFVKSSNYRDDGPAGQAWRQLVQFLKTNLD